MLRIPIKIYLAYLAISLLLVLPALNFLTPWFVQKALDRELKTEIILFNPFTLSIEVREAELPERNGEPFAGFHSAQVNLSLESIWSQGWVFDAVRIDGLYADVKQLENGDFNFSDMLGSDESPATTEPEPESSPAIPGLTVHDFYFNSAWVKFTDYARQSPFSTHFDGLTIAVNDLSTVLVEGKPYSLTARDESGGELRWEGTLSVPGAESEGSIKLSKISLHPASRFIEPWVKFDLTEGQLHVEGQYSLNWNDGLQYHIKQTEVRLSGIDIVPKDTEVLPQTGLKLGELLVSGIDVNGDKERANIEAIKLTSLDLSGWSEGEQVSLVDLFSPAQSSESDENATESETESGWSVGIAETTISGSQLRWRTEYTDPPQLHISPLEATVSNVQWPPKGDTHIAMNIAINEAAKLDVDANLSMEAGDGSINYTLSGLPVAWFNPNLPEAVDATIDKGSVTVKGDLKLADFAPTSAKLDGEISDFAVTIEDSENAITSWDSVRWNQLTVDLMKNDIILKELFLTGYSGRLHIFKDGTINSQRALNSGAEEKNATDSEDDSAPAAPWSFAIPSITLTDSALDFMDESLPITFRTVIGDLNGGITGIDSTPGSQTTVDLLGSVDGYAPVKLAGTAQPFNETPALDLGLTFDGIDLVRLTPYSGTYAGYAIDRGILNLDLNYKLENSRLEGNNQVVIDQLKLGEKIDNDTAVDLPLGLAIALLTDMNGVIDLEVPVSGDVDDPSFAVGSVIASAFINIITKAVTAPFSLLANLIGTEDDLQRVTFSSGSSELDETAKTKLSELASAMTQRPALKLVITGRLHPTADRANLQMKALEDQLIAGGLSEADWKSKSPQWAEAVAGSYQAQMGSAPEGADESTAPTVSEQLKQLASKMEIADSTLAALAEERAVAVKRYLVNEVQLPAERSVLEKFDLADEANQFSGVEMDIDS